MAAQRDARRSITSGKSAFLNAQVRLLDTPLKTATIGRDLPASTLDKIVSAVNKKVTQQNKLVYASETRRHVLEQVDGVYWRDVLAAGLPLGKAETIVGKEVDLQDERHGVRNLPEDWQDVALAADQIELKQRKSKAADTGTNDNEGLRYSELRERIVAQSERKANLQRKLAQYQQLQMLLKPVQNPTQNVQPNLVNKEKKALESELAKTRVLLARVGHALQQQPVTNQADSWSRTQADTASTRTQQLEALLDLG